MPVLKEEIYTIEDIYALPEGERAELLDGQIYMMAAPSTGHQRMAGRLYYEITDYIRKNNGDCEIFSAPFAVFLSEDTEYVEPDLSVICDPSKIDDRGCHGAPDWVIEIVSPSSSSLDYILKLFKYRSAGVREYWIIDPDGDLVTVYDFDRDAVQHYSMRDAIPVGIYSGELLIHMDRISAG